MMTGTIDERPPMKANRLSSAPNAEIADLPVFLPIATAVLRGEIGEAPQIAQADRGTCRRQDESELPGE